MNIPTFAQWLENRGIERVAVSDLSRLDDLFREYVHEQLQRIADALASACVSDNA